MGFFIGLSFGGGPQWRLFGPLRMMHSLSPSMFAIILYLFLKYLRIRDSRATSKGLDVAMMNRRFTMTTNLRILYNHTVFIFLCLASGMRSVNLNTF